MNKNKQNGFSHILILTVALAVAVVGLLGFVFWQNFLQPKDTMKGAEKAVIVKSSDSKQIPTEAPAEVALDQVVVDQTGGSGLALRYPKSWKYEQDKRLSWARTITSPDSKVIISFDTGLQGLGGTCGSAAEAAQLGTITSVDKGSITGLPGYGFVAATVTINSNTNTLLIGIESNSKLDYNRQLNVGDNGCILGLGIIKTNKVVSSIGVDFSSSSVFYNSKDVTINDINNFKESDDYKITKRIIESVYLR